MTEPNLFEPVLDHYGGEAPSVGVDTSREAAVSVDRPSAQRLVLDAVKAYSGAHELGMLCGEVEEFTGLTHQSASARLRELSQDPDSPIWKVTTKRRYRKTGRYQHVYYTAARAQALGLERAPLHPERPTPESIGMVRVPIDRQATDRPLWGFPDEQQ